MPLDIKHIQIIICPTVGILHIHKRCWKDVKGCCLATGKIQIHLVIYLYVAEDQRKYIKTNQKLVSLTLSFCLRSHRATATTLHSFPLFFLSSSITRKRQEQGQMTTYRHIVDGTDWNSSARSCSVNTMKIDACKDLANQHTDSTAAEGQL